MSYERHLVLARETGDKKSEGGALGNLALVAWETGKYEEAIPFFQESLKLFRQVGARRGEGAAVGNMGLVFDSLGRFEEARECFEKHRDISREIGYRLGEAKALGNLGIACAALGLFAEALDSFEADLEIGSELGNPMHIGINQMGIGSLWLNMGQYDRAGKALTRAREIFEQINYRMGATYVLELCAFLAEQEARPEEAQELHLQAQAAHEALENDEGVAEVICRLGCFHARRGEFDRARTELERCLVLSSDASGPGARVLAVTHLATLPGGDVDGARRTLAAESDRLSVMVRIENHFALYQASGEEEDLAEARRLLDFLVCHAPEQYRESIRQNVALHRAIDAALA